MLRVKYTDHGLWEKVNQAQTFFQIICPRSGARCYGIGCHEPNSFSLCLAFKLWRVGPTGITRLLTGPPRATYSFMEPRRPVITMAFFKLFTPFVSWSWVHLNSTNDVGNMVARCTLISTRRSIDLIHQDKHSRSQMTPKARYLLIRFSQSLRPHGNDYRRSSLLPATLALPQTCRYAVMVTTTALLSYLWGGRVLLQLYSIYCQIQLSPSIIKLIQNIRHILTNSTLVNIPPTWNGPCANLHVYLTWVVPLSLHESYSTSLITDPP